MYGYKSFVKTFNIQINFAYFYSFLHSIPRKWKDCLQARRERSYIKQNLLETLLKMGKVCRQPYSNMLSKKCTHRSHEIKWLHVLQNHVTQLPWPSYYSVNFQCTTDIRMRAFQYKILSRILQTNKYLKMFNVTDDESCYFCQSSVETIEPLFYFCPVVQDLWSKLAQKMKPHLDITPQLKPHNVLLGCLDCNNKICLNHIFNIVKRYIYSTKCNERVIYVEHLMKIIKQQYCIEKELVKMYGKNEEMCRSKWQAESLLLT